MSSTLTGTQIKNTYPALLKFGDNGSLPPTTLSVISDGLGNDTPLLLSGIEFKTQVVSTSKNYGLWLDLSSNSHVALGDYNLQYNFTQLYLSDYNNIIQTSGGGSATAKGFKLDFTNKLYSFGDFNTVNNGTSIKVDDTAQSVTIEADQDLAFVGTNLESTGAGGSSGKHLRILVNGAEYKIQLLDP